MLVGGASCTETWTGWKGEMPRTAWSLTTKSARSCTWHKIIRAQYRLRSVGWSATLLKGTQRSWQNISQLSTTAAMKANQILDCSHRGIASRVEACSFHSSQTAPGALFPALVPTVQKDREGLQKGYENNQKSGELDWWGQTEGVRSCLSGENKTQGGSHHNVPLLNGWLQKEQSHTKRSRGKGCKLHHKQIYLDMRFFFLQ